MGVIAQIPKYRRWMGQGFAVVLDQAIYSGTHFYISIMLARWMSSGDYGIFAISFSIFSLMGVIYSALMIEPMMILGLQDQPHRLVIRKHILITTTLMVFGLIYALSHTHGGVSRFSINLILLSIGAPAIFWMWLKRRELHLNNRIFRACIGTAVYGMVAALMLLIIKACRADLIPVATWPIVIVAAIVTGVAYHKLSRSKTGPSHHPKSYFMTDTNQLGAQYLLSAFFNWLPLNVYVLVLGSGHDLDHAAKFKALSNLIMPVMQATAAIQIFLVAKISRQSRTGVDIKIIKKKLLEAYAALVLLALPFLALTSLFGSKAANMVYSGRYSFGSLTILILIIYSMLCLSVGFLKPFIRSMRANRILLLTEGLVASISLFMAIVFVAPSGDPIVAFICLTIGTAVSLAMNAVYFVRFKTGLTLQKSLDGDDIAGSVAI